VREGLNTLLYLTRSGCQGEMLPHDLLPKSSVYDYFARWREEGTWTQLLTALRKRVRQAAGREPTPRAAGIDSPAVKTTEVGGRRAGMMGEEAQRPQAAFARGYAGLGAGRAEYERPYG
jgi:transposase